MQHTQPAPIGAPKNVLSLADARHRSSRQHGELNTRCQVGDEPSIAGNSAHVHVLQFAKTADLWHPNAQHVAHSQPRGRALMATGDYRIKRKSKTVAVVERLSKAETRARIRERIEAVATALNLASEVVKLAMTTKHEHLANFAKKHGIKIEWLIAGAGCVFRSRGELFETAVEFERLLKIEKDLGCESHRRRNMADRLAYEKLGIDPEDREACGAVHQSRDSFEAWREASETAERETGSSAAWRKWNSAVNRRVRCGKRILKFGAQTSGMTLLIRLRVFEVSDDDLSKRATAEIRAFFRARGNLKAADCGL